MSFIGDCSSFLRQARRHFHDVGAVMPSSRFLGRALASELKKPRGPCRILEVGPGTGSVTAQILRALQPGDRVDLVELNTEFVNLLQKRLDDDSNFGRYRDQV